MDKNRNEHRNGDDDAALLKLLVGPSTTQTPYLVATNNAVWFTSVLSTGDQVGVKDGPAGSVGQPWRMVGVPDGLGAFDNGDGTITVLMNQEIGATQGVVREHGAAGSFVSKLVIDKTTLKVVEAGDLIQKVMVFDAATDTYVLERHVAETGQLKSRAGFLVGVSVGIGDLERERAPGTEIERRACLLAREVDALLRTVRGRAVVVVERR